MDTSLIALCNARLTAEWGREATSRLTEIGGATLSSRAGTRKKWILVLVSLERKAWAPGARMTKSMSWSGTCSESTA
eukprot:693802-Pyramimonas_sp.AAC.1